MSNQNEEDEPKITEENYKEVIDKGIELNHDDYKKLIRNDKLVTLIGQYYHDTQKIPALFFFVNVAFSVAEGKNIGQEFYYDTLLNKIGSIPPLHAHVLQALRSHYDLNYYSKKMGDAEFHWLIENFKYLKALKHLDLRGNNISDREIPFLCENIGLLENLIDLQLSDNPITEKGLAVLFEHFDVIGKKWDCSNYDQMHFGDAGLGVITNNMNLLSNLTEINLCACDVSDDAFIKFMGKLVDLKELETLVLSYNNIGDKSVEAFVSHSKTFANLDSLEFSHTNVTDKGVEAISNHMVELPGISHLDLKDCKLTDNALPHLKKILETSKSLTHVYLGEPKIKFDSLTALAKSFPKVVIDFHKPFSPDDRWWEKM